MNCRGFNCAGDGGGERQNGAYPKLIEINNYARQPNK